MGYSGQSYSRIMGFWVVSQSQKIWNSGEFQEEVGGGSSRITTMGLLDSPKLISYTQGRNM